jgi:hypothetical protein
MEVHKSMKRGRERILPTDIPRWNEIALPLIRAGWAAQDASQVACAKILDERRKAKEAQK